ncbi:MAG TPA: hypothetical protein VHW43_12230, partial [Puia sp.]|nr:hypothetical protein [Puia sp.]
MSKLKFVLPAILVIAMFSVTSCTKKTTTNTVVQDSIYYSAWAPLNMTLQIDPTTGDSLYFDEITAPAITAKIISQGAVLGYYGYPSQSGDTLMFDEAEYGSIAAVSYTPGSIEVEGFGVNLSYSAGGFLFKYV